MRGARPGPGRSREFGPDTHIAMIRPRMVAIAFANVAAARAGACRPVTGGNGETSVAQRGPGEPSLLGDQEYVSHDVQSGVMMEGVQDEPMHLVCGLADRVMVLHDGSVLAFRAPDKVLSIRG